MEFPPPWSFFPMEDFELAAPRDPGDIGVEAMAQARANGRVLDHFRIVLGGSQMLEATVNVKDIFPVAAMPSWSVAFSCWPRDVAIRRNMASSAWQDIRDMVAANDIKLLNGEGANVASNEILDLLDSVADKTLNSASIRWWIGASEDGRMQLQLQAAPSPASGYLSKPAWKG